MASKAFLSHRFSALNDQMSRRALIPLAQTAEETGAAMIWVRHLTKRTHGQRAIYRGSGSIAIIGSARSGLLIGQTADDDDLRVLACTKSNAAVLPPSLGFRIGTNEHGQPVLQWTGTVDVSADELVLASRAAGGQAVRRAKEFLENLLRSGPTRAALFLGACLPSAFAFFCCRRPCVAVIPPY